MKDGRDIARTLTFPILINGLGLGGIKKGAPCIWRRGPLLLT